MHVLHFFGPWKTWHEMGPGSFFVPANADLADVLGDIDLEFDSFHICYVFWIPNFWISRFPDFQNLVQAGLGPGRA